MLKLKNVMYVMFRRKCMLKYREKVKTDFNKIKKHVESVKSKTVSTNNHAVCVRDEYLVDGIH